VSCRLLTSATPHTTRASSLGEHPPPPSGPPTRSRRRHVPLLAPRSRPWRLPLHVPRPGPTKGSRPSLHHGLGLGPTLVTSLGPRAGTGLPSPPAAARLLAHPSPATGPAWLQRIPPGPRIHTVRLPRGTGHGKGPCPAQARIGFPKSSWSRPQRASTVHRSRQTAPEPCLTRPPADSTHGRHKARCALQSIPSVQCPGEGP
jgi:hypothetical protein